jgi:3-oxoacyl-[acyl-carrier protein] reductase
MDLNLRGKQALVCGGSGGIGLAAAQELAQLGAQVVLLARNADALQAAVDTLPHDAGQQHGWIQADVAQTDALRAQVQALVANRPVQILVNNTGGPPGGPALGADPPAYLDAFQRHLIANQTLVQVIAPGMQAANWGRIVNVISTSVREPILNLGVSNTIRGAVASWAKTLSRELAGAGITVNNILPGYTETARIAQIVQERARASGQSEADILDGMRRNVPAGRFAQPSEIGAVIAFLCSPAAAYVNGVSLAVDGGRMQSI